MFVKLLFRCVKIEFFPRLFVDFGLYGLDSFVRYLADVPSFRYVLPDELVGVLDVSLLQSVK